MKKCFDFLLYIFFLKRQQIIVILSFLICQIKVFVLQQRKNEDIVVQIRPV